MANKQISQIELPVNGNNEVLDIAISANNIIPTSNINDAQVRKIIIGTSDPTSSTGNDGDIYFKYEN